MSNLREPDEDEVIGILCSDPHLSHKPPLSRSAEASWYDAMSLVLDQLYLLQIEHNSCPIVYAGDVFHKWNSPPELINFALKSLPRGFAVAGDHDLPNHNYDERRKSAYWTMVEAGVLENLDPGMPKSMGLLTMYGFPWGTPVTPCPDPPHTFAVRLAVVHQFLWTKTTGYPGAPEKGHLEKMRPLLNGYDAAVFGDNHKSFISRTNNGVVHTNLINTGCLIRRNSDEQYSPPTVGLLRKSGEIEPTSLSTEKEVWISVPKEISKILENHPDVAAFVEELDNLQEAGMDFFGAVKQFIQGNDVGDGVRRIILESMENKNG